MSLYEDNRQHLAELPLGELDEDDIDMTRRMYELSPWYQNIVLCVLYDEQKIDHVNINKEITINPLPDGRYIALDLMSCYIERDVYAEIIEDPVDFAARRLKHNYPSDPLRQDKFEWEVRESNMEEDVGEKILYLFTTLKNSEESS